MSMILTIAIKNHILKEESRKKFDQMTKDSHHAFIKELEVEVQKVVLTRMHITQELISSRYVATTSTASYKCDDIDEGHEHYKTKNFGLTKSFPRLHNESQFNIKHTPELQRLRKIYADQMEEKKKFESALKSLLYAYKSKTKLAKDVPELAVYFKEDLKMSSALVPMTQIMNIRKQLFAFDITKKEKNDGKEKVHNPKSGQSSSKAGRGKVAS